MAKDNGTSNLLDAVFTEGTYLEKVFSVKETKESTREFKITARLNLGGSTVNDAVDKAFATAIIGWQNNARGKGAAFLLASSKMPFVELRLEKATRRQLTPAEHLAYARTLPKDAAEAYILAVFGEEIGAMVVTTL